MTGQGAARPGWVHGKAIVDGQLRYLSSSAIQKADHSLETGCERRWLYEYKFGIKEDGESPALIRGKRIHEQLERYLLTGDRGGMESAALAALFMVEPPGPDLGVEHSIVPLNALGVEDLSLAPVRPAGVPLVGKIDLIHARGTNRGGSDIEDTLDPPGTIEVVDWKTTSRISNAKRPQDLPHLTQMLAYAKYAFAVSPSCQHVRLSHGVIPASGLGRKVTIRVDRDTVERNWKRVEVLAGHLRDVAGEPDPDRVPANTRACNAYNRPCPALGVCRAPMQQALSMYLGPTAAAALTGEPEVTQAPSPNSITARLEAARAAAAQAGAPAADPFAETRRKMAQEEARAAYPWLEQCLSDIRACGVGFPTLTGLAAGAVGRLTGQTPVPTTNGQDHELAGSGTLAGYRVAEVDKLPGALAEIRQFVAQQAGAQAVPSVLPPEAPASNPAAALAAMQAESGEAETEPQTAEEAIQQAATGAAPPKKKRGRPPKNPPAPTTANTVAPAAAGGAVVTTHDLPPPVVVQDRAPTITPQPSAMAAYVEQAAPYTGPAPTDADCPRDTVAQAPAPNAPGPIHLYENVALLGHTATPLEPLVFELKNKLAQQAGGTDVRTTDPNGPLGFGRWRGALAAFIRATPIPGGRYSLDTRGGGELVAAAAEALREVALASGGTVTRGMS